MEKELILLRGIPGSGKSTLAKLINGIHLEADMYFIDPITQEYKFDASKIKQAHEWCQNRVEGYMAMGYNVCVSNTFTQEWEMDKYYWLAEQYGYRVHSLVVEKRHMSEDIHNVPKEHIEKMRSRFEIKL